MYTKPHAFISLDTLRWNDGARVQSGQSAPGPFGDLVEIRGALVERRNGRFTLVLRCLPLDGPPTDQPKFLKAEGFGIRPATTEETLADDRAFAEGYENAFIDADEPDHSEEQPSAVRTHHQRIRHDRSYAAGVRRAMDENGEA